ncbi:type 1 glutamine amidotransferase [Defluviimonas sp. SAOS-178_SWC]|uniref:type 1 glutamine amidotransferase n=1 Tax=Defluviimonas sp. SAOS-178_SWC TaxID=3121287 RepID=UPI003221912C
MRVAVVENTRVSQLGQVGAALAEAGAEIATYRPFLDGTLPADMQAHDALVVLGGEQNALDDTLHPYLPALARLMRAYGEADKAVLGICLGAQILARGYGATNILGAATEFGWHRVRRTAAGASDPVLSAAGPVFPIFQWHSDTFTLPEGAVHLAENSAVANQAFRLGRAAYGTQFHFEANRSVVAEWTEAFPEAAEAMRPDWRRDHPAHAEAHGPEADAAGLALARAWVALI